MCMIRLGYKIYFLLWITDKSKNFEKHKII